MRKFHTYVIVFFSCLALGGIAFGVYSAMHSPLFLVQVVEVADAPDEASRSQAPVDPQTISDLAAVPVGKVSLFDLDLKSIERRILTNSWVRSVRLQKRFPQTLSISVTFREPRALMQAPKGALAYVDLDGNVFGQVDLELQSDLPIFAGFSGSAQIKSAFRLLEAWEQAALSSSLQISSLSWDAERGYRAWVTYPYGHSTIELGQEIDADLPVKLNRLSQVFAYLNRNRIAVRQVWADSEKKIVVKTAHGS